MPIVSEARLRDLCLRIVLAMQAPQDIAEIVADILVKADVKGVDSHGCRLLSLNYIHQLGNGMIVPAARPEVIRQDGATTIIEGHWGFGHAAARLAAGHAIESARQYGIGTASLVHVSHIARLGEYAEQIAEQSMLGMVVCNANRAQTPYGGMERIFGTNPIALAVPRRGGKVLLSDFAMSGKSINKLKIACQHEQSLAEGVILDKEGYPTTDPNDFFDGGVLLPAGGYKGYALTLFIDIIGGILVGAGCAALIDKYPGNGTLFIALDIARWRPLDDFTSELEELLTVVKNTQLAPGAEEILLPGELESRAEDQRRRKGIPLDNETWQGLQDTAAKLGLPASLFAK